MPIGILTEGLHAHEAGKAENGNWRIFEVWESYFELHRFLNP